MQKIISNNTYQKTLPLLFITLLTPIALSTGFRDKLIVWNVGQGQWITWVKNHSCLHFDMGGEKSPPTKIRQHCSYKKNFLFLSHSDQDHIQFIKWGVKNLADLCLIALPRENLKGQKAKIISALTLCPTEFKHVSEISFEIAAHKPKNDLSRIYLLNSKIHSTLIPGDSTVQAEKIWARSPLPNVRFLILGHHGSKTSTGHLLLSQMRNLKMSISSARKKKYGHPHPSVVSRLQSLGVSTIQTELWGNIILDN